MRNTANTGSKWFTCGLCGFEYPEKYRARQRGLDVCTVLPCVDDPGGQSQGDDPRSVQIPTERLQRRVR